MSTTGSVLNRYVMTAWGEDYGSTRSVHDRFDFTGREHDQSGLMHYRARTYDPRTGRFLQPDPAGMPDGPNRFTYVANDPLNATDPQGTNAYYWTMSGSSSSGSSETEAEGSSQGSGTGAGNGHAGVAVDVYDAQGNVVGVLAYDFGPNADATSAQRLRGTPGSVQRTSVLVYVLETMADTGRIQADADYWAAVQFLTHLAVHNDVTADNVTVTNSYLTTAQLRIIRRARNEWAGIAVRDSNMGMDHVTAVIMNQQKTEIIHKAILGEKARVDARIQLYEVGEYNCTDFANAAFSEVLTELDVDEDWITYPAEMREALADLSPELQRRAGVYVETYDWTIEKVFVKVHEPCWGYTERRDVVERKQLWRE